MDQHQDRGENIKKLNELIKDIQFAMLTTADEEGQLHSRPMATQREPFDGTLWFFTYYESGKSHELEKDHHVNVSYASPEQNRYVSLSGTARVFRDQAKAKELWNPALKAFFPQGLDDPNLALLRVDVQKAEYWDSPSSKVVQAFGFLKAVTTGKRYEGEGSEHEKLMM